MLGIDTSRINETAFANWENELQANDLGRRWIGEETQGATLLAEIMSDGFADLYLNASNEYTPIYRKRDHAAGVPAFRSADLAPAEPGRRAYSVQVDPEQTFANVVVGDYSRKPEFTQGYSASKTHESSSAITAVGTRHRRRLRMNWLYTQAAAEPRAQRELAIFSREVRTIQVRLGPPGLVLDLTDQFTLAHSSFELSDGTGSYFQVRDILHDFNAMEATVKAWNLDPLTFGYWTLDAAPNYGTASAAQKASQGFWTDANGDSDQTSKWF